MKLNEEKFDMVCQQVKSWMNNISKPQLDQFIQKINEEYKKIIKGDVK